MTKRKGELLGFVLSVSIFLLVICNFTELVTPKRHIFGATWNHFLQEEPNSLDVLFIGSSMAYCDVIPAVFWDECDVSSYVVAGPELSIPMERYYLQEALKTQSPKIVFFEISGIIFGRHTDFIKDSVGQMPWGINRLSATFTEAEASNRIGLLFPMYFYHSRWDVLTNDDRNMVRNGYQPDMLAGFTYMGQYREQTKQKARKLETDEANIQRNREALVAIWKICTEEGITPVFYLTPAAQTVPEDVLEPLKEELSMLEGTYVLDCNEDFQTIGFDLSCDFYDSLHLNAAGAEKFTRYLAEWSSENLTIQGSIPDAELWQSRLDFVMEKLETPMEERES